MTIHTLIKEAKKSGLVIIPRREYEELLDLKRAVPTFRPTKGEQRIFARAQKEIARGKFRPWSEVKHELARIHRKRRGKAA